MYKELLTFSLDLMAHNRAAAQLDSLITPVRHSAIYSIEVAGLGASSSRISFWLKANQYGTVPNTGLTGLVRLGATGYFGRSRVQPNRRYSYGVEVVGIAGRKPATLLPQAYLSVDRGWFSLWAGRKKEIIGLGDSILSSGFYSWSGNALPITKVQIGTNGFVTLRFTNGLIAINAFRAHGWFPNTDSIQGSYLQIGTTWDLVGAEFELPRWNVLSYYQHPYEDKSGLKFVNFPNGLYGLQFKRKPPIGPTNSHFRLNELLLEYLTTMNQSGFTLGERLQGIDDYFNNFQYINGWTTQRQVIGTPFISPRNDVKPVWQNVLTGPVRYRLAIINNRVQVIHVGASGVFPSGVQLQTRLSYSVNQGTIRIPFGQTVGQFSGVVWLIWPLRWLRGSDLRTALAVDHGDLYVNTTGAGVSIRKTFGSQRLTQDRPTL